MNRSHRTLNLMLPALLFFFMRAAAKLSVVVLPSIHPTAAPPECVVAAFTTTVHTNVRATSEGRDCGQICLNRRTLGILAAADLDELLDVGDFGRHFCDLWWIEVGDLVVRLGAAQIE